MALPRLNHSGMQADGCVSGFLVFWANLRSVEANDQGAPFLQLAKIQTLSG